MIYQKDTKQYMDFLITLKKDFKLRESPNFIEIVKPNGQKIVSNKNKKFSITKKTYLKGIEKEGFKPIRLSTLSCLGKDKMYKVYKNGEHKNNELHKGDTELQNFYLDIRYATYGVLKGISEELGSDFCCWKTDCIYFYDTKKNRKLVKKRIEEFGLHCKTEAL